MALVRTEGVVLRTYPLGDTSRIVVAYSRELGLLRLVAKGARKSPNRFGFALEPLSRSRLMLYHKPDRDLHLVSQAEVLTATGSRITDLTRLTHAHAAIELVDRLVWGEEPHPELYALLVETLDATCVAPTTSLSAVTLAFELQTASLLGYRPRLDACAECARAPSTRRLFSPARGGLLCDACAAGEPGVVTLSADALAGLTLLLTRPVVEAGRYIEIKRAGEILKTVEAFLRHHFQRFQGLKSLELLRALAPNPSPEAA
ncbi:MAG: DNA repair protein RecO [Candidatus Eisenbacteria bacterium]